MTGGLSELEAEEARALEVLNLLQFHLRESTATYDNALAAKDKAYQIWMAVSGRVRAEKERIRLANDPQYPERKRVADEMRKKL